MTSGATPTPLVLVVDGQELNLQKLESVLRPKGYVVLKAYSAQQALELSAKVSPDAILVNVALPDLDGIELLRRLKQSTTVHGTTPLLIVADDPLGKAERLAALDAGAWDLLVHPIDANELILRLDTLVQAKQEADRIRDDGLTDPTTGLYNIRGVLRRTKEHNADAMRSGRPLTCIVFGAGAGESEQPAETGLEKLTAAVSDALKDVTRVSDTVGRLGPSEFVVVAPGTGDEGAVRLADRVLEALKNSNGGIIATPEIAQSLRAGLFSIDATKEQTSAEDLLLRATVALRKAQQDAGSFRVRAFDA